MQVGVHVDKIIVTSYILSGKGWFLGHLDLLIVFVLLDTSKSLYTSFI